MYFQMFSREHQMYVYVYYFSGNFVIIVGKPKLVRLNQRLVVLQLSCRDLQRNSTSARQMGLHIRPPESQNYLKAVVVAQMHRYS